MPTQADIARAWKLSKQRVGKLVKKGMPTSSLKAAEMWRADNIRNPRKFTVEAPPKGKVKPVSSPSNTGDSLQDALNNSIKVADGAFIDYEFARVNSLSSRSIRLSEHNKAMDARLKAEKAYREELERRKILVPIQEVTETMRRCMDVVLRRLKKLPQELGPQCNPQSPLMALSILENEVNEIIAIGQKAIINAGQP